MDLSLQNRVALVAGSSRGIGKGIAAELLGEGCKVCITGRDAASLGSATAEFQSSYGADQVLDLQIDLTDESAAKRAADAVVARWGALDILVANIGSGKSVAGWEIDPSEWDRVFALNFRASVALAQAAIPKLAPSNGASIVFISSICAVEATPAPLAYSAAKAALNNYAKNLSRLVARQGIRVNTVAPGNVLFQGSRWEKRLNEQRESVTQMLDAEVPLRRFGTPQEIAALVAFLCSERAAFITGSCFVADGGQTRTIL